MTTGALIVFGIFLLLMAAMTAVLFDAWKREADAARALFKSLGEEKQP